MELADPEIEICDTQLQGVNQCFNSFSSQQSNLPIRVHLDAIWGTYLWQWRHNNTTQNNTITKTGPTSPQLFSNLSFSGDGCGTTPGKQLLGQKQSKKRISTLTSPSLEDLWKCVAVGREKTGDDLSVTCSINQTLWLSHWSLTSCQPSGSRSDVLFRRVW